MLSRRTLGLVLGLLLVGALFAGPAAAKKKQQKTGPYYGVAQTSGTWQYTWSCDGYYSYSSSWTETTLYRKAFLEPAGELDQQLATASGAINWSYDRLCNGMLEAGACSVGPDPDGAFAPTYLDKVKGGLRVDFVLPLLPVGCGAAKVAPYGVGFEYDVGQRTMPFGIIPAKKIGKPKIVVPISGSEYGSTTGRSFSGSMSGTLELTRKKPLLPLAP